MRFLHLLIVSITFNYGLANLPPVFIKDMNNLALSENTQVGQNVYTLTGHDPEKLPVRFSITGTDKFIVNATTGAVYLANKLDREVNETLKFIVSIEDIVENSDNNIVSVPVSIIILDENDNEPEFKNSPYEVDVAENTVVGTTILSNIIVEDKDTVGQPIEVTCVTSLQWPEACGVFEIVSQQSSERYYNGSLVLKASLNYNVKHSYQFQLYAYDGLLNATTAVEVRVIDIQNVPPIFTGSLAAVLSEDAPIGTLVLMIHAKDGDRAHPRNIFYDLLTNPHDYFILDSVTGELKTGKPLDRESLDIASPLNLTIRAREIVDGRPVDSNITTSTATVTINIRDVNDEPPRFNRKEYVVEIPENMPFGTPLPNLDMFVTDTDIGINSEFSLRLSDVSGAFSVEPQQAVGSTQVSIRLTNISLDYENPNQRKFIILVIAEELYTNPRLSSTATVTVTITDVNDNFPVFKQNTYNAFISEQATFGTYVSTVTATDRDHARLGTEGIVYEIFGTGAEKFTVDNRTGVISVAFCLTPGKSPCLDYETLPDYFLNYKATDEDGLGQSTVVPLKISLLDTNDNAPQFLTPIYISSIDEGATRFDPELQVQAVDLDKSSTISYQILNGTNSGLFNIDSATGKIGIVQKDGLDMTNEVILTTNNQVTLIVQATDGFFNTTCEVKINIKDVNNNPPIFETNIYNASVPEDSPIGTNIVKVLARDMDTGLNSVIKYFIQNGAFDDFQIEEDTGIVKISSKLDYDRKRSYNMQIIATDQGIPVLTGTTMLTVIILNENDKSPYFTPQIQRTDVSVDADLGTIIYKLSATDPDVKSIDDLKFEIGNQTPIAVDKNGKLVTENSSFKHWFDVESDGKVKVMHPLNRNIAAVITLPVVVRDDSASNVQLSEGSLIITIVDVNTSPPSFRSLYFVERFTEEQPINTTLTTFHATDVDSTISHYSIEPANQYFQIDNITGVVKSTQRIDYERIHQINFTVVAYDTGVPQLSTSVAVTVNVGNINDETPNFEESIYDAKLKENSPSGTSVLTVHAIDKDEGVFGEIRYSIFGEKSDLFTIDMISGELKVASNVLIDRETIDNIWFQAKAIDNAPLQARKTATVPIHIEIIDENDNPPVFGQRTYKASVAENLSLQPPTPILQVRAEDKDILLNGKIKYSILEQTEEGAFNLDPSSGILYPAVTLHGNTRHHLKVSAVDNFGSGEHSDIAYIDINVESVNRYSPKWVVPSENQPVLNIQENSVKVGAVLITLNATDEDEGENGRVTYYLKVGNKNVHETNEFYLDENTGELKTKMFLDREQKESYKLGLVAADQGTPSHLEVIKFLTINLDDSNDNKPLFIKELYEFAILENQSPGTAIGTVKALDKDTGDNGRVYYHILKGNDRHEFVIDKTQGIIRTNATLDREEESEYSLFIFATNEPVLEISTFTVDSLLNNDTYLNINKEVTKVIIKVLDENDNPPKFEKSVYYAGVKETAKSNETIISIKAYDPDFEANSEINYFINASNVFKYGDMHSSGSVIPSPFNITKEGYLITSSYMAEYNQDRFVLNVVAQEGQFPHRKAKVDVNIWVVKYEQLIRIVVTKSCAYINQQHTQIISGLQNATQSIIVITAMKQFQSDRNNGCNIYIHLVDPSTLTILPVDQALKKIDEQYDNLKLMYEETNVDLVELANVSNKNSQDYFDPALAALIALLIVLFTGIITFVVVCSCLKQWVLPIPMDNTFKEKGSVRERSRRLLQELSSTDNPLWAEHKLRLYEEQELTMNVFGENAECYPHSQDVQVDNTYATIPGNNDRDYATLNSPRNLAFNNNSQNTSTGPEMQFEAMLGFQGCTFQPDLPDTPEPPPRTTYFQNSAQLNN